MKKVCLIVALTKERGIGFEGKIPWTLKKDMKFFREMTTFGPQDSGLEPKKNHSEKVTVIMGRKTWESIPSRFRPLPNRLNIVLTSSTSLLEKNSQTTSSQEDVLFLPNLEKALEVSSQAETIFIIGGTSLYETVLEKKICHSLFVTQIDSSFPCDTFFPSIPDCYSLTSFSPEMEENGTSFRFERYDRSF